MFYPRERRGIQYNGPLSSHHITQFLLNAQNPLTVVHTAQDLLDLRASRPGGQALVGHFPDLRPFDSETLNIGYRRFLHASYELLEYDPFRSEVGPMAVVTSPRLAFQLKLGPSQPVRYFHWDGDTSAYPNRTISSANGLMNWAFGRSKKLTSWMGPVGRKSNRLAQQLLHGKLSTFLQKEKI